MNVRIKTDLTVEPVTSAEAKLWCKVTGSTEDSIFTILISSARKALEKYTASSFGVKTIHATWTEMPDDWTLELPYGPIVSVSKVYKIDQEGTETELTVNVDYWVNEDGNVRIGEHWSTGTIFKMAYRVEYTAGYGDSTNEALPTDLKTAILMQIATDYEFRENISIEGVTNLSNDAKSKAAPYRRYVWF
jgi:uncharacterized phiE125 gp8 family phage protein